MRLRNTMRERGGNCPSYRSRGVIDEEDSVTKETYKKVSILQELYIEFFATFIPGFILVSFTFLMIFIFFYFVQGKWLFDQETASCINPWGAFGFITIFSYVVGAILYRKEPNVPDKIAAYQQWRRAHPKEQTRLAVQFPGSIPCDKDSSGKCPYVENCTTCNENKVKHVFRSIFLALSPQLAASLQKTPTEYPYHFLRKYLLKRGMKHLIVFVPWCGHCTDESLNQRSKVTINILKTRIKADGNGYFILDLLRNEGHIRMMTSLWYVVRYLRSIAFILAILLFLFYYILFPMHSFPYYSRGWFWFFIALAVIFTTWGKRSIERTIHYVRSREIVTVLEQAHIIGQTHMANGNPQWMDDFYARNESFMKWAKKCENKDCRMYKKQCCGDDLNQGSTE